MSWKQYGFGLLKRELSLSLLPDRLFTSRIGTPLATAEGIATNGLKTLQCSHKVRLYLILVLRDWYHLNHTPDAGELTIFLEDNERPSRHTKVRADKAAKIVDMIGP